MSFVDSVANIMPEWARRICRPFVRAAKKCLPKMNPSLRPDRPYLPWLWWVLTRKRMGSTTFTVVTPVYNTGRYLDTYFKSLTRQTLDFKRHLHIIMVDDGSTDNSAEIIKRWQKKYPRNINYIHQENQGINRARNRGINHVLTPWVIWIDSDDFVHPNYFYEMDKALKKHKKSNLVMLAGRQIVYYDAGREFKDNRPFKSFFEKGETLLPHNDLRDFIHYTVNSAIFSTDEIHRQSIRFALDSDWRCFDDAHFVIRYLEGTQAGHVLFCRYPRYYYRKRGDSTSNVDVSLTRRQAYIEVLEEGYLDLLKYFAQKYDFVPKWVQNSIIYDMSWKIKDAVNSPKKIRSNLSPEECSRFLSLSQEVFSYIEAETIYNFSHTLSGFWHYYQIGACHALKGEEVQSPFAYIETVDRSKNLLKFRTYSSSPQDTMAVLFDGVPVKPVFSKTINRKILDRTFIYEHNQWIPFNENLMVKAVTCAREDTLLDIDLGGHKKASLSSGQISIYFMRILDHIKKPSSAAPWILIDRDVLADDNAEHLYRYIAANHPEQPIYFAVRKSSPCWKRLQDEGFHLLDFGSPKYEEMLRQTPKLISSHMDHHIIQFKPGIMQGKQYICLQHGVTKDDLSNWLNGKTIDLFITVTPQEYDSIVKDASPYKMGKKEVVLTGFPRHDSLLTLAETSAADSKTVLIMPTWRNYLTGNKKNERTHAREMLPDFFDSIYAKAWLGLLRSERLVSLANRYGFKLVFFPHFGMQEYFKDIAVNPAIEVLTHGRTGIQRLFAAATFMVTDYSSVAFEMAFLQKAVLYYQFDEADFFKGDHVYTKGYFDYRQNGFGPVCTQEADLLNELELLMAHGGQSQSIYLERMKSAFPFRDGKNCERVYQAIKALDVPA